MNEDQENLLRLRGLNRAIDKLSERFTAKHGIEPDPLTRYYMAEAVQELLYGPKVALPDGKTLRTKERPLS